MNNQRPTFFEINKHWKDEWQGMPEFIQEDLSPFKTYPVHFRNEQDMNKFTKLIGQKITDKTKYVWFPQQIHKIYKDKIYINTKKTNPKYPIYIISKGRWESRQTSKILEKMKVPYHIVIEPQEYDQYISVIDSKKILVLPFKNLNQGSIPARNWVWRHSISIGAKRHWILDDNIVIFARKNNNTRIAVESGAIFKCAEDFVNRYENIALAGFQYRHFSLDKTLYPAFFLNTRIYSCILIKNDIPYRWRGRYNEDTDLSIRVLKDGWCTILFYAFLQYKTTTMTMKGGNTDELYQNNGTLDKEDDGRWKMAESLRKQHPDIVTITKKWNRWQHHVDYRKFKGNKLIRKSGITISQEINNYGMKLVKLKE